MANHTIDDFRSGIAGKEFARSNLFTCEITFPKANDLTKGGNIEKGADTQKNAKFFIRAAQMPASTVGVIEVPFQGRTYKIPGDRTYEPWTITVMNDTKQGIRKSFEAWINAMNNASKNRSNFKGFKYHQPMYVHLLSKYGNNTNDNGKQKIKTYKFHHSYPTNISAIDLDANANDAITEFTVEMQYAYWTIDEGSAGTPGGKNVDGVVIPDGAADD